MKLALTGIALVIIGYVLFGRVRYAREYIQGPAQVLWNKDKIFILVPKGLSIREGHRIELWLEPIFRFVPRAEVVKKDLVVLGIDGGSLKTWHLENFGFGGSAFPYNGTLHYTRGALKGADGPPFWRWTGLGFERLDAEEAKNIRRRYPLVADRFKAEGWFEGFLSETKGEKWLLIERTNGTIGVTLVRETNNSEEIERLRLRNPDGTEAILFDVKTGYRRTK